MSGLGYSLALGHANSGADDGAADRNVDLTAKAGALLALAARAAPRRKRSTRSAPWTLSTRP